MHELSISTILYSALVQVFQHYPFIVATSKYYTPAQEMLVDVAGVGAPEGQCREV